MRLVSVLRELLLCSTVSKDKREELTRYYISLVIRKTGEHR